MNPTIFELLLSCRSCNSAVLVEDPAANRSKVAAAAACGRMGLVIRHGTTESNGSVSSLEFFPFEAADLPPQLSTEDPSTVSRQVIYVEDCANPESRRQISREWGLRRLSFEQHLEDIAAWSGSKLGECPCRCHHRDSGADECISIDTTLALVGQQSDRYAAEGGGQKAGGGVDHRPGWPSEGRERAQSEEIPQTDLYILSWREQCRRASH